MNNPKISVIVPVYKAEAYLHRCVDSLLAQTFQDFEVLLIDDGSPDRSGEICDEYARQDSRIRVFHKENGGVSSARQYGMDHAQGEYTIHADPDDWVEPTMLEELYQKAKEEDADMVICDFYYEYEDKRVLKKQKPSSLNHEAVLRSFFYGVHGNSWSKLVRRECFIKYNIKYPLELSYCEDLFVNACLVANDIRVSYLPKAFYHYDLYINSNSLVHRSAKAILLQERQLYNMLERKLPAYYFRQIFRAMLLLQADKVLHIGGVFLKTFRTDFKELRPSINELSISSKKKILLRLAFVISPRFVYICLRSYSKMKSSFKLTGNKFKVISL